jgi:lysozyme
MKLTTDMAMEVLQEEAIVRMAYKDSVGVWTWSGGITSASGHKVERYIDNPQPIRRCLEVYLWKLQEYLDDVADAFRGHDLTEEQIAAALSFNWNTRAIKRAKWVELYKQGKVAEAKRAFMSWKRPSSIIPRRKRERDLFFGGDFQAGNTITEIKRLTRNYHPIFSSGVKVRARRIIDRILKPSSTLVSLAAHDRFSTTELAAGVGTVTTVTAGVRQISEDVGGIAIEVPPWGIYVLGAIAIGVLFWIIRERKKYKVAAREELEDFET